MDYLGLGLFDLVIISGVLLGVYVALQDLLEVKWYFKLGSLGLSIIAGIFAVMLFRQPLMLTIPDFYGRVFSYSRNILDAAGLLADPGSAYGSGMVDRFSRFLLFCACLALYIGGLATSAMIATGLCTFVRLTIKHFQHRQASKKMHTVHQ